MEANQRDRRIRRRTDNPWVGEDPEAAEAWEERRQDEEEAEEAHRWDRESLIAGSWRRIATRPEAAAASEERRQNEEEAHRRDRESLSARLSRDLWTRHFNEADEDSPIYAPCLHPRDLFTTHQFSALLSVCLYSGVPEIKNESWNNRVQTET